MTPGGELGIRGHSHILILFVTVPGKFTHSFPDVSQMTSETLPALGPITVTSNRWLGPISVSSLGHPAPGEGTRDGIRAGHTRNNWLRTRDAAGKDTQKVLLLVTCMFCEKDTTE